MPESPSPSSSGQAPAGGETVELQGELGRTIPLVTGVAHRIRLGKKPREVKLCLRDDDGEPLAGKRYKLDVEGQSFEGESDPEGMVVHEVPATATTGTLEAWLDDDDPGASTTWELELDALPPGSDLAGIQARLKNLGFYDGEPDGSLSDAFRAALVAFQEHLEFEEPSGELDDETKQAIERLSLVD